MILFTLNKTKQLQKAYYEKAVHKELKVRSCEIDIIPIFTSGERYKE